MTTKILLTSFDIWEAHHHSNASDDLLSIIVEQNLGDAFRAQIALLRKLPVDFQLAPKQVITRLETFQADLLVCCGMAEQRSRLTVESSGTHQTDVLRTTIEVNRLVEGLAMTSVSHDAGTFVCNHLYYSVLKHIQTQRLNCQCLFVHVPLLHEKNRAPIVKDFLTLLHILQRSSMPTAKNSMV